MSENVGPNESGSLVIVASPLAGVRKRWRRALEGSYTIHEVAERGGLERSMVSRRAVGLLLDLALPGLGGPGGVAAIQKLRPATRIIVLSAVVDEREGIASLKAGARGYCHREIHASLLEKATVAVLKGEIWAGRKLISRLLEELAVLTEHRRRERSSATTQRGKPSHLVSARSRGVRPLPRGGGTG